jgi:hypothetical protein
VSAVEVIGAGAATEEIVTDTAEQLVAATAAEQRIVAKLPGEDVSLVVTDEGVVVT